MVTIKERDPQDKVREEKVGRLIGIVANEFGPGFVSTPVEMFPEWISVRRRREPDSTYPMFQINTRDNTIHVFYPAYLPKAVEIGEKYEQAEKVEVVVKMCYG